MPDAGRVRIGTAGWSYRHWVGPFYPESTRGRDMLDAYARRLDAAEINNTFYSLPKAETLRGWAETVPPGFVFALKVHRRVTHMKKLKDPEETLPPVVAGARALGDALGPLLVQLPPNMGPNRERLRAFLDAVPAGIRCAVEFRHPGWFDDAIYAELERAGAALVIADMGGETTPMAVPGPFVYVRLHGPGETAYTGSYDAHALDAWAERVAAWRKAGRDVYVVFDNDEAGYAPQNACALRDRLAAG